jgi:hypothetical protein
MREKKLQRIKKNAISIICNATYNYLKKKRETKKEIYSKFLSHCASLIQNRFRDYLSEKKRKDLIRKKRRQLTCLWAVVLAWKTRKILKLPVIIDLKKQILEVDKLGDDLLNSCENLRESVRNKYIQNDLSKGKRKLKIELINYMEKFLVEKNWVSQMYAKIKSSSQKKVNIF